MNLKKQILIISLLFLIPVLLYGQTTPLFVTDSLDAYVQKALKTWNIPGAAVCIVKDGKVVVSKGYGVCEYGKNDMVDENTLFMIGSNTKAFTGTALAIMEAEQRCSLEDKVTKWVPAFSAYYPWVTAEANLTDILCHRMGTGTFQGDFTFFDSDLSSDEIIKKYAKLEPIADFRTSWGYCNTGFLLGGMALKSISGLSWEEFIRRNFFEPLKMKRSLALISEMKNAKNKAAAHSLIEGKLSVIPYGNFDALAPAASICSSVSDMSHWVMALLDSGKYDNKTVIPYNAILKSREPVSIIGSSRQPFVRSNFSLYALGWELQDYEGRQLVMHTGGVDGFVTSVTLLPEENLGIVVLTNTDQNYFYEALKLELLDAYLGLPYRNYSKLYNNYFQKKLKRELAEIKNMHDSVAMNHTPPLSLDAYTGTYTNEVYGNIVISLTDESLQMSFQHHKNLKATLEYMGENRFLCTYNNPLFGIKAFPFVVDGKSVKSFTLSVNDFLEYTTYDFIKSK